MCNICLFVLKINSNSPTLLTLLTVFHTYMLIRLTLVLIVFAIVTSDSNISVAYPNIDLFHAHRPLRIAYSFDGLYVFFKFRTIQGRPLFQQRSEVQEDKANYASILVPLQGWSVCHMCSHSIGQSESHGQVPLSMWWEVCTSPSLGR